MYIQNFKSLLLKIQPFSYLHFLSFLLIAFVDVQSELMLLKCSASKYFYSSKTEKKVYKYIIILFNLCISSQHSLNK